VLKGGVFTYYPLYASRANGIRSSPSLSAIPPSVHALLEPHHIVVAGVVYLKLRYGQVLIRVKHSETMLTVSPMLAGVQKGRLHIGFADQSAAHNGEHGIAPLCGVVDPVSS